jgi:HAD superfamily hydrolase (TIGR01549 family)
MLDVARVKAITLDLDDTLWPIWPTIERAEHVLHAWLTERAPMAAALFSNPAALRDIRNHVADQRPEIKHDLSAVRRESIRLALYRAGDDPLLADEAFEAFFAARQQVELFEDARPALEYMAARYPVVSLSNGNADLQRVGIAQYFRAAVSARDFGIGKPDPRIFVAAAGAADVRPEQVLHVGDDATLDVVGALNAGMQAVWLNRGDHQWPHEQQPDVTVKDLRQLCDLLR